MGLPATPVKLTTTLPLRGDAAAGLKAMTRAQLDGTSWLVQLSCTNWNSEVFAPVKLTPVTCRGVLVPAVTTTVRYGPRLPTGSVPKLTAVGAASAGCGVQTSPALMNPRASAAAVMT